VEGEDNSLIDILEDGNTPSTDGKLMAESLSSDVRRVLSILSDRERNIIMLLYGIGGPEMSLEEIGYKEGLTRERVRQIKEKAIKCLKGSMEKDMLKNYL